MKGMDYEINPHWKFLQEHYGTGDAFSIFGPYAGAGIKVKIVDPFTVETSMDLTLSNTNYVGTHFGGSLYSMCDPFYMFILMQNLGPGYIVWDKSASIDFLKPGRGLVKVTFHIPEEEISKIRNLLEEKKKMDWESTCEVFDESGTVVTRIKKVIYIRRPSSLS